LAAAAKSSNSPFVGIWRATDPVDGSTLTAVITGSQAAGFSFFEYDNYASGCVSVLPPDPGVKPVGTITATGNLVSKNVLSVSGTVTCIDLVTGATWQSSYSYTLTYNPSAHTLLSNYNELFHRISRL